MYHPVPLLRPAPRVAKRTSASREEVTEAALPVAGLRARAAVTHNALAVKLFHQHAAAKATNPDIRKWGAPGPVWARYVLVPQALCLENPLHKLCTLRQAQHDVALDSDDGSEAVERTLALPSPCREDADSLRKNCFAVIKIGFIYLLMAGEKKENLCSRLHSKMLRKPNSFGHGHLLQLKASARLDTGEKSSDGNRM